MLNNPHFTFVVDSVAVYRLTKLILEDKITEDLREKIFDHFSYDSKTSYFFTCPWCVSIWAAGALFALRKASPETADYVSSVLAASAVTGILNEKGI